MSMEKMVISYSFKKPQWLSTSTGGKVLSDDGETVTLSEAISSF